jgi:hypothetical protein
LKKALLACGVAAIGALGSTSTASAAGCTGTMQHNGQTLTVAVLDATLVTGPVDATGCDVGVGVDAGHTDVTAADVHGATKYGVLADAAGGPASVTISRSHIHDIGSSPFDGLQQGVGAEWANGATGGVDSSTIDRYQKNGVVVDGNGTSANVTNDQVSGLGPVAFIAQNGVQYSDGAHGDASYNTITDNQYTGCSNRDAAKTGCIPYVATGLLLFNVDPRDVTRSRNLYRNDQRNEVVYPSAEVSAGS